MKLSADSKRCDIAFQMGDYVFVKLQPYHQNSVALHKNQKLSMRHFGPFKILKCIGPIAYKLELPATARIHPVFHISLLKKCEGTPSKQVIPEPLLTIDTGLLLQPEAILDQRRIFRNGEWTFEVLVQWQTLPREETSWENVANIQQLYLPLALRTRPVSKEG